MSCAGFWVSQVGEMKEMMMERKFEAGCGTDRETVNLCAPRVDPRTAHSFSLWPTRRLGAGSIRTVSQSEAEPPWARS